MSDEPNVRNFGHDSVNKRLESSS